MAKRIRGVRLTREERLEVRLLISRGSSFEEAAAAARCSKKTVQRLLSSVGGMPARGTNRAKLRLSLVEREEISLGLGGDPYTVTAAPHAGRIHLESSYDWRDRAMAFEGGPGPEPYFVGRAYLPVTLRFEKRMPEDRPLPS